MGQSRGNILQKSRLKLKFLLSARKYNGGWGDNLVGKVLPGKPEGPSSIPGTLDNKSWYGSLCLGGSSTLTPSPTYLSPNPTQMFR